MNEEEFRTVVFAILAAHTYLGLEHPTEADRLAAHRVIAAALDVPAVRQLQSEWMGQIE